MKLSEWLASGSRGLPILQFAGAETTDSRPQVTSVVSAYGLDYDEGGLTYLPALECARLLKDEPSSADAAQVKASRCLVLQGLATSRESWATVLPFLARRAGLGRRTVLLDRETPAWLHHPSYTEFLRPATEVCELSTGLPREDGRVEKPAQNVASDDSDRELILVAASVVAAKFRVPSQALLGRRSNADELKARQAAIFVVRKWKRFEFKLIGNVLGQRTAVSAAQAFKRIEDRCKTDPDFGSLIDSALEELAGWEKGLHHQA